MEIKTKLEIGQIAFYLRYNIVKSGPVALININIKGKIPVITYVIDDTHNLDENDVHATKEDLLKSL